MSATNVQKPSKSLMIIAVITALVALVYSVFSLITNFTVDTNTATQLMVVALLILMLTGVLIVALFFLARKTHNPTFSQRNILIAGIAIIFLILGMRFEIFMKLLTLLLKFG